MRVIGIDHGRERTGLAVTDPLRIIASALDTVATKDVLAYLKGYAAREAVEGFVVGLPVGLNGKPTDGTALAASFIATLRQKFPACWVETVDERFTSRMAQRAMAESGKGRMARRDKGALDRISATILLQEWLAKSKR